MENKNNEIQVAGNEGVPGNGFLSSLADIFVDPVRVFRRIDRGLEWWKPFIVIAVVAVALAYFSIPVQQHAQMLQIQERGMSAEEAAESIAAMEQYSWLGLIFAPVSYLILFLIGAGIVHLIVSIMTMNANFKKTFVLVIFCSFITTVEQIIRTVTLRLKGIENLESLSDMNPAVSLSVFLPELDGFWKAFLDSLSLFQVWYYIIFTLGLMVIFKIGVKKALVPVVVIWIISLGIQYFSLSISGG